MSPIVLFFQQAAVPAGAGVDPAAADPMGGLLNLLIVPLGMLAIFYFLLIRPQNNRMKKTKEMHAALKKGDTVITQGGIIGKITKLADNEITIDTGENTSLRIARFAVSDLYTRPAAQAPANDVKES